MLIQIGVVFLLPLSFFNESLYTESCLLSLSSVLTKFCSFFTSQSSVCNRIDKGLISKIVTLKT